MYTHETRLGNNSDCPLAGESQTAYRRNFFKNGSSACVLWLTLIPGFLRRTSPATVTEMALPDFPAPAALGAFGTSQYSFWFLLPEEKAAEDGTRG